KVATEACEGLDGTNPDQIVTEAEKNLYEGAPEEEIKQAMILASRALVEKEPNYTFATARILLDSLRYEALNFLDLDKDALQEDMKDLYPKALSSFITKGIELKLLNPKLAEMDLEKLGSEIMPERDNLFTYLGLQTLYDRYFIHSDEVRFELPQVFFMRVSMGLALNEENKEEKAIEFYKLLSSFDYMSSTPTLFNSGTLHSQLSSCYLTTVPDDLYGIYGAMRDNAMLSKWAGGLGNDWTPVRGMGAHIKGTNGRSQGVVPFLKVVNDTAVAVNQGGKRKGAVCAYLETWHLDIEEFLELRKNTGDDRRRTHDMNTANWIPDLFMERVMNKESWTLFSPNEAKDLHDLTGNEFKKQYEKYEEEAKKGNIKAYKEVDAEELWRKIISMLFETGHPWLTFKDACNLRSPQQHTGVIHSSNLCTEITLNTSQDEIAVCNLGSVNLKNHLDKDNNLDKEKLQKTISTAIRMLDNVIDINYYAVPQAENSNFKHRPIGLGIMGFQDILQIKKIPYSSDEAVELADDSMETVSYFAIEASSDLAEERGSYSSYEGSLWSQGIFPIDSISILKKHRTEGFLDQNEEKKMDWDTLKEKVKKQGIRNSNVMAIAPTATIANITGVTQSIEPTYSNLFVKSNLSGEFTVINENLVNALKEIDMWDEVMVYDLKNLNGSLETISRVPDEIKRIFATSFEIEPKWLIESASRRQKWIDQSQSLNLYVAEPNGKKLDVMYKMAWLRGLKTTYYLRSKGATTSEKSTISNSELNKVQAAVAVNNPSTIDDEECEACQ
ncbi:ribonucleoside-diphosphate reductase subunit alpha, partial [SAR86 cluster bacterium]|nr:ribonucleoside-diphosphate reductase subunit alpha [SAR86 cluster bacterium]